MAERLAENGHAVQLVTSFPHYPEWRFHEQPPSKRVETSDAGVRTVRVRHRLPRVGSSVSRVLSEVSFGLRAVFARWGRPDAVVLVSPALFASVVLVPRLLLQRLPFTVWVQDLYGLGVEELGRGDRLGIAAGLVGRLERWLLCSADSVVVIHEGMAASVLRIGVAPERVSVVRNWTHIRTSPQHDRDGVRAEFGWRPDETVVLHTGNMGVKQGLMNVVEAARIADAEGSAVRFVLMGDGSEHALLSEAGADVARLQLVPPQAAELYEQTLQAADVLLVNELPDLRGSALPSKLTSYFASGRPVLAATHSASATAGELRRAAAGELIEAGAPAALLHAAERLAADPARMAALAAAGLAYRSEVLTLDGAARSFERVLAELPARHTTHPIPADEMPVDREIATARAEVHHTHHLLHLPGVRR